MIPLNAMAAAWALLVPLTEELPDPGDVKPGWVGGTVVVLLAVAVVLLLLSFRKQLRKADRHFADSEGETRDGTAGDSDSTAGDTERRDP